MLLLAPQHPLGGVEAGVGEGCPDVGAVAGHGVVEPAPAQQPEVGHPGLPGCRRAGGGPDHPPAAQQVRGQGVDRLQHGQAAQGGLDAPGRGGPGRVLVAWAVSAGLVPCRLSGREGGTVLVLQVGRVVVVQGESLPEVRRQLPLGVEPGQPLGADLLPGAGVPVAGGVERLHRFAGQEPAAPAPLGHAPHHRLHPARFVQCAQHPSHPVLGQAQDGRQVGRAGQGHPGDNSEQPSLFLVQLLPLHHARTSIVR